MLLVVAAAPATPATTASNLTRLVERLQDHYQATDSLTAKFVETLGSPGAPPRERSGQMSYRKPGMIRWEFGAPQPETIVADGTTLFDYDPGLNQVVETPLKNAFKGHSAVAFILGVGNLRRDFSVASTPSGSADGLKHLMVSPKDGGDKIELGLDTKTMNIMKLRVIDGLGNSTTVQFSSIARNVAIDRAQFKFVTPEGADIVKTAPSP
ncbi:MAG TPA: outer membrane lipoprotein carrier protein LolA [Candidatus Binataceae bacterium]|nr:outer membrane lipoprotein carrier protein LolA [Candidatus Binataceae bacterium]